MTKSQTKAASKKKKELKAKRKAKLMIKVGSNFKKWRLEEELVLTQVSDDIEVSQGSLSDIENGHSLPAFQTVFNLIKKYPDTQWDKVLFA